MDREFLQALFLAFVFCSLLAFLSTLSALPEPGSAREQSRDVGQVLKIPWECQEGRTESARQNNPEPMSAPWVEPARCGQN